MKKNMEKVSVHREIKVRDIISATGFGFLIGVGYAQHDPVGAGIGLAGVIFLLVFTWKQNIDG